MFNYEHKITTDDGLELDFCSYTAAYVECVYVGGIEFEASDDTLRALAVVHNGEFKRINDFYLDAYNAFEEMQQEALDEYEHQQEISSPYQTGRI